MFGVLFMALEYRQAGFQQALELGVAGRRNQQCLKRAVHLLVVGNLMST
jgi:hypothetical protein